MLQWTGFNTSPITILGLFGLQRTIMTETEVGSWDRALLMLELAKKMTEQVIDKG